VREVLLKLIFASITREVAMEKVLVYDLPNGDPSVCLKMLDQSWFTRLKQKLKIMTSRGNKNG
jgi:hypothetical protein